MTTIHICRLAIVFALFPLLILGGCVLDRYQHYFTNTPLQQNAPAITVQNRDNLYQISKRYDVTLRDLIEVNHLKPPYHIHRGQPLLLPKKRIHIVRRHETLTSIARQRNVDVHSLVKMNNLKPPYDLHENQRLKLSYPRVPMLGSLQETKKVTPQKGYDKKVEPLLPPTPKTKPIEKIEPLLPLEKKTLPQSNKKIERNVLDRAPPQKPSFALKKSQRTLVSSQKTRPAPKSFEKSSPISKFQWPVTGKILAKYGKKSAGLRNDGINIQAKKGSVIKAAESGQVVYAGNALKGYGNLILIKHRGGWMTAYAHAQKTFVSKGDTIKMGQKIALVGSTGHVKKPQLHFEIRKKTRTVDPVRYLK